MNWYAIKNKAVLWAGREPNGYFCVWYVLIKHKFSAYL